MLRYVVRAFNDAINEFLDGCDQNVCFEIISQSNQSSIRCFLISDGLSYQLWYKVLQRQEITVLLLTGCIAGCYVCGTPIPPALHKSLLHRSACAWFNCRKTASVHFDVWASETGLLEQRVLKWASWDDAIKPGNSSIGSKLIMDKAHSGGMFISVTSLSHIF